MEVASGASELRTCEIALGCLPVWFLAAVTVTGVACLPSNTELIGSVLIADGNSSYQMLTQPVQSPPYGPTKLRLVSDRVYKSGRVSLVYSTVR
jgi:hypothetical protein